ncbi:MAG: exo-alpha-sialidase [Sphingobacteriales bacterium]|nr:exo-alpha-sialidase [Sphingobacteriales bacterium]OJY92311.1 MAG: hypothetical protein BGP14_13950 [Sphingobacteriales bacterium 44-15]
MPSFAPVLCILELSLLYLSCQPDAKHASQVYENKEMTVSDTLPLYASGSIKVKADQLVYPEGIRHILVEPDNDEYKFLHDPAIIYHKDALVAAWYNCPEEEIEDESCIRARRSFDGGVTWSKAEVIAEDKEKKGVFYVPVQMLSFDGDLYAFVGKMTGHDRIINTTTYRYSDKKRSWQELGETGDLFLPNCTPVKLENGNWIMSGRVASSRGQLPLVPAVLISPGDSIEKSWRVVKLPQEYQEDQYPETTVIVKGKHIYAFTRADGPGNKPDVFFSNDYGESWIRTGSNDFTAIPSKLYAGTLTDGRGYIVFNYVPSGKLTQSSEDRQVLAIAISKDGNNPFSFSNIYKVQSAGPGNPLLSHYPCVLEHGDDLYIIYTASFEGENKRHCELAIVPLKSLH